MKAFASVVGLIFALALSSSDAVSLSCAIRSSIPDATKVSEVRQQLDAQTRLQFDAQIRQIMQKFDADTRQQFGNAEIVAEAKVISLGETAYMHSTSSQRVEVVVTRYLRAPSIKEIQDRYFITAVPDALHVNDSILFFARAESKATWEARLVKPDPKVVQSILEIPSTWTQRIWYAQGACANPIYPLAAPENAYLVQFTRQLANDKLAPATLTLSFSLGG